MDVERIQKINSLAVDLMRQGLAADREEAVIQAEKIYRSRGGMENVNLRDTMQSVRAGALPEQTKTAPQEQLSTDEIKNILEQNAKFMVAKIKEFQDKIAALEKDMSSLRSSGMFRQHAPAPQNVQVEMAGRNQAAPAEMASSPQAKPAGHPRVGNWKEEDVSIEKFFKFTL